MVPLGNTSTHELSTSQLDHFNHLNQVHPQLDGNERFEEYLDSIDSSQFWMCWNQCLFLIVRQSLSRELREHYCFIFPLYLADWKYIVQDTEKDIRQIHLSWDVSVLKCKAKVEIDVNSCFCFLDPWLIQAGDVVGPFVAVPWDVGKRRGGRMDSCCFMLNISTSQR